MADHMRDTAGINSAGPGAEQRPFGYQRWWGRWPCELREQNEQAAIMAIGVLVKDIPTRVGFYDPFDVYLDEGRTNRPPHLALATCGGLSAEECDQIAGFDEFRPEDHERFFTDHGCTEAEALDFSTRWGMLEYGHRFPVGRWAEKGLVPLREFRAHASLTWTILQIIQVLRSARQSPQVCRHWYGMLQWLASIPGPCTFSGPAASAFKGTLGMARLVDGERGDWRQRPKAEQRLAVLLESVINILLQEAQPICRFLVEDDGRLTPVATYSTLTLLQAIHVMLYLDLTRGKEARTCAYRDCHAVFRPNAHQKAAERNGLVVYCCPDHGVKEAQRRYREGDPSRARKLEQARQRKRRSA